jgi:hypothetical protein
MNFVKAILKMIYRVRDVSPEVTNKNVIASITDTSFPILFIAKFTTFDFVFNNRLELLFQVKFRGI